MVGSLLMDNSLSKEATDWREGRRLRAFELKQQGWSQQQIAQALGVSKGAVSQWMKRGREGGVQALKRRPVTVGSYRCGWDFLPASALPDTLRPPAGSQRSRRRRQGERERSSDRVIRQGPNILKKETDERYA